MLVEFGAERRYLHIAERRFSAAIRFDCFAIGVKRSLNSLA